MRAVSIFVFHRKLCKDCAIYKKVISSQIKADCNGIYLPTLIRNSSLIARIIEIAWFHCNYYPRFAVEVLHNCSFFIYKVFYTVVSIRLCRLGETPRKNAKVQYMKMEILLYLKFASISIISPILWKKIYKRLFG